MTARRWALFDRVVSDEQLELAIHAMLKRAQTGDVPAMRLLMERTLPVDGRPPEHGPRGGLDWRLASAEELELVRAVFAKISSKEVAPK